MLKGIAIGLACLVGALAFTWIAMGNGFFLYKVFAPKQEAVRRQVFEQSKAYNEGMIEELQNMQMEYIKATPDQKDALASIILHRAAAFDLDNCPPDLRDFIENLKKERGCR